MTDQTKRKSMDDTVVMSWNASSKIMPIEPLTSTMTHESTSANPGTAVRVSREKTAGA